MVKVRKQTLNETKCMLTAGESLLCISISVYMLSRIDVWLMPVVFSGIKSSIYI